MSDEAIFRKMDAEEREYAPEQLPAGDPEQERVRGDAGRDGVDAPVTPPLTGGDVSGFMPAVVQGPGDSPTTGTTTGFIPGVVLAPSDSDAAQADDADGNSDSPYRPVLS